jgi:UDP-glucose 4-epimerase
MRILFTGASSFTGYWFVKELAERGHEVIVALKKSKYSGIKLERIEKLSPLCKIYENTSFGAPEFLEVISQYPTWDLFCHHAAQVENYRSPDFDVGQAVRENTYNLLPTLSQLTNKGCHRWVITGSVFEPGEGEGSDGLPAVSPYGLSKGLTAQIYRYYADRLDFNIGKFVIPNPFGPLEEDRFTGYLIRSWLKGEIPTVKTPDYIRDNVPVTLLAKSYASFAESRSASLNPSFYVSTQGDFTARCATELSSRLKITCPFELSPQNIFAEPKVRINSQLMDPTGWNESQFWDEFTEYYLREASCSLR